MNKHLKRLVIFLLFPGTMRGEAIPLTKLHYRPAAAQENTTIELGNLSLYFNEMPRVESSIISRGEQVYHHFFLPNVETSAALQQRIDTINKQKEMPYAIQIKSQEAPRKGIEIVLAYPRNKIGVKYNRFASISLQKGLIFRLYNKEMLLKMNKMGNNIITTAMLPIARNIVV